MGKITLDTITGGYDLSKINSNFEKLETELNDKVFYRNNPVGEPNTLSNDMDINNYQLFNAASISTAELLVNGLTLTQEISNAATGVITSVQASVTTAAGHATSAGNSASQAATHETNTASLLDSFDDRYLGAKSTPPSVDNDGNTLLVGALYWDTTLTASTTFPASDITFAPTGGIAAVNVQNALAELDTEKAALTVFAAPPAIGNTTPAAGTFTTLSSTANAFVQADGPTAIAVSTATLTDVTNWTERFDTSASFVPTTGVFTVPRTGKYQITCSMLMASEAYTIGDSWSLSIVKNGNILVNSFYYSEITGTTTPFLSISHIVQLTASDLIKFQVFQNSGGVRNTTNSAINNFLTITEIS